MCMNWANNSSILRPALAYWASVHFWPGMSTTQPGGEWARASMARYTGLCLGHTPGTQAGPARPTFGERPGDHPSLLRVHHPPSP